MIGFLWYILGFLSIVLTTYLQVVLSELFLGPDDETIAALVVLPYLMLFLLVNVYFLNYGFVKHRHEPKRSMGRLARTAVDVIAVGSAVMLRLLLREQYNAACYFLSSLTTLLQSHWQFYRPTSDLSLPDVFFRGLMQVAIYVVMSVMGINLISLSLVLLVCGCFIFWRYWFYSVPVTIEETDARGLLAV